MAKRSKSREWLRAIAERVAASEDAIQVVLDSRHIVPAPVIASPRRLVVRRLAFSGEKTGVSNPGEFAFAWDALGPGLWGIVSEANLRGKSSLMEIVRWMLRGRFTDRLSDVRAWIHECALRFELDGVSYEVRVQAREGLTGVLVRCLDVENETQLASFESDAEFESAMSNFFMRELGLDAIWRYRTGTDDELGKDVVHGWPSLSGVLFIGTEYSVLLGDIPAQSGITTPLMQMYLGLPWVTTLTAAKTAEVRAKRDREVNERRKRAGEAARGSRRAEIQSELTDKRKQLEGTRSDEEVRSEISRNRAEFLDLKKRERATMRSLELHEIALAQSQTAHNEDRRYLQAHIDAEAAGEVFRRLAPTICPRCDCPITDARRKREREKLQCSVCGDPIVADSDAENLRRTLDVQLAASKLAKDTAERNLQACDSLLKSIREKIADVDARAEHLTRKLVDLEPRRQIQTDIAVLEARLAEVSFDPEPENLVADEEVEILKAVVAETEERVKAVQTELLKSISTRIVGYAQRFGMANLSSVDLKGNAQLPMVKGGNPTSYSHCTDGEKLRLKVATTLAIIDEAEKNGVGRHPGLLMIDSPGAHEVAQKDLDELISGLKEITQELPHLQVFVASIASAAVLGHLPKERLQHAHGNDALW